jgi:acyl dehydratase
VRTFTDIDQLTAAAGEELGTSEWLEVTQDAVDRFAEATGDHQWIHVDTERAATGPFGGTIAHGYLTLSLVPALSQSIWALETEGPKLNYGVNKVRFPTPLRVGKRVRAHATLSAVTPVGAGTQLVVSYTVEIEGEAKPACVAETVVLLLG